MQKFLQKNKSSSRHKFRINFTIVSLSPIPNQKSLLYLRYSRGKKWNNETMRVLTRHGIAEWNQSFDINKISLFKASSGGASNRNSSSTGRVKYKKKYIVFKVYETNRDHSIGKCKVSLDEICEKKEEPYDVQLSVPITLWKRNQAHLDLKFHVEPLIGVPRPRNQQNPHGTASNWIDDTITDHTTMTDMSADEDEHTSAASIEESNEDDTNSISSNPKSSSSSNHPTTTEPIHPAASATRDSAMRARGGSVVVTRKPPQPSGLTISFDSPDTPSSAGSIHENNDDFSFNKPTVQEQKQKPLDRRSARIRNLMKSSKERRKQCQSISMDGDDRSYLDNIGDQLLEVPSAFTRNSSVENLATNPAAPDSATAGPSPLVPPKSATNTIFSLPPTPASVVTPTPQGKHQQDELRFLYQKIALQETEKKHRILLDRMIRQVSRAYPNGVNISAAILLRCLQNWDCFASGSDTLLKEVVRTIEEVAEKSTDIDVLTYWLSACTVMLNVTQRDFSEMIDDPSEHDSQKDALFKGTMDMPVSSPKFQEIKAVLRKDSFGGIQEDDFSFDNPVSSFQRDLREVAGTIYTVILQHVKKTLQPILKDALFESEGMGHQPRYAVDDILKEFDHIRKIFERNHLFAELVSLFFDQLYYWIDAQCFNALMDSEKRMSSMSHGLALKMNLTKLEHWSQDSELCTGARFRLCHIRQASDVLIMQKSNLVTEATRKDVCPDLNVRQIRQILATYRSDAFDQGTVPSAVIRSIPVPEGSSLPLRIDGEKLFIPNLMSFEVSIHQSLWQTATPPQNIRSEEGFEFLS